MSILPPPIYSIQSFRFVERASFRRFVLYLNPKLKDTDIPHKSTIAEAVTKKGKILDDIDFAMIQVCLLFLSTLLRFDAELRKENYLPHYPCVRWLECTKASSI